MRAYLRAIPVACLSLFFAACSSEPDELKLGQTQHPLVGKDGAQSISTLNQAVNAYGVLSANATKGTTSIQLVSAGSLGVLQAGDLLMLIQMQGATIDTFDSDAYGTIIDLFGAGLYEMIGVTGVNFMNNTITLDGSCGGLRNTYLAQGHTQVIRVPQYTTLNVPNSISASIGAPAWDGNSGGVVALMVQDSITFEGSGLIDVSGKGFRGGGIDATSGTGLGVSKFCSTLTADGAEKGEGIAGYQSSLGNCFYGRGAPANGGGGGNYARAGGGGGANGDSGLAWNGHGVMENTVMGAMAWTLDPGYTGNANQLTNSAGGGRGGYSSATTDQVATTTAPGAAAWGGDLRREVGGRGGRPLNNDPLRQLFMGGGGGSGEGTTTPYSPRAGAGGGIVMMFSRDLIGTVVVKADGNVGQASSNNEGGGGGGAGGSIVIAVNRNQGSVTAQARGGQGGNNGATFPNSQGAGGGGGGGYIAVTGTTATRAAQGGLAGSSNSSAVSEFPVNGATRGAAGQPDNDANSGPGKQYPICIPTDVTVTTTAGQNITVPGGSARFTASIKNVGPLAMRDIKLTETQPLVLTSVTWTCTGNGGATCASPTGSGNLPSVIDLPVGGELVYVMNGLVSSSMAGGQLTYSLTATLPNGYYDLMLSNNFSSANCNVVAGSLIDLNIAVRTDPLEPAVGENVTYFFTVNNLGPSTTSAASLSFTLPMGASLRGVLFADNWNCNIMNQTVTCLRQSPLARDQTSELQLLVSPPAGATAIRIVANVSASDNSESKPSDNTVVWDIPIGASRVYAAGGGLGCALLGTVGGSAGSVATSGLGLALLALAYAWMLAMGRRRSLRAGRES
ncbi:MAG TPA: hypothetical protein PKI03_04675 [Pseudomonadota bacterium]|nr:hypothetical protein [Pseudomonadota bacterium]